MSSLIAAAEAVSGDPSSSVAISIVPVFLSVLAVAIPVALLVGLIVLAGRVHRYGDRLAQVEARLAVVEDRHPVGQ